MPDNMEKLYEERFKRYVTALKNGKPDRVPIRPFAAEFTSNYSGFTVQEITHQYEKAFEAVRKCAKDFQWDATVINMVYVWSGLTDHFGHVYYKMPGIELPPDTGFQYFEPATEEETFMKEDEYDLLIESPTEYLANVWIPRISSNLVPIGEPNTYRNNMAWLKGGIAMMDYFGACGRAVEQLKTECGTASAIAGILKAPFDILADKLRGFRQVSVDIYRQPDKVEAACQALVPHMLQNAKVSSDPTKQVPVGLWLHRGTYFSERDYARFFWPYLKEIIVKLWEDGIQTLWYGEGTWIKWAKYTRELPENSIVYHVDKDDIFEVHKKLGDKFCISGGIPNDVLAYGTPEDVKEIAKKVIKTVGKDGGYIMDAAAILQDDAKVENVKAMTDAVLEYGEY
jgi:uroporphyrinogen-III decarboxylase